MTYDALYDRLIAEGLAPKQAAKLAHELSSIDYRDYTPNHYFDWLYRPQPWVYPYRAPGSYEPLKITCTDLNPSFKSSYMTEVDWKPHVDLTGFSFSSDSPSLTEIYDTCKDAMGGVPGAINFGG